MGDFFRQLHHESKL